MTTEIQPVDPRIPFYIPENWIQPTGSGGGSFVSFPTAQTANILFPGSISCSNLKSFAPSAPMNLYNDSTSGSIQIGNNSGYTGGIVINSNAVAPVNNTIRIGDTNRPVIMPKVKLTDIEPNVITVAGVPVILPVFINSDTTVASGKQLLVNEIKPITFARVSLPNGATTLAPGDTDTSSRVVTSQWVRNQGFTTTAGFVTYNGLGPFTVLQTFDLGIRTNTITLLSASNLSLPPSVTATPPVPDNTALVPTCNWVNTTITNALNATTLFAKLAATAAFTAVQTFNLGIKTNTIALVSGTTLSLPNILTNSIGLVSGSTLSLPNILTNSIGLVSGTTLSLPNILTNSIGLVSGTSLTLPAATTTAPADNDAGSSRIVTSQWVRNQNFTNTAGFVTYAGAGPFTTLQTFTAGIKTDSIVVNSASFLDLPPSTTTTPIVPDNTTKVPTCNWVNTTIDNALNTTTLFAKLAGTAPFTALQNFAFGIEVAEIKGFTTASAISIGGNQTAGGALTLGSASSAVSIPSGLRIPAITSVTTNGALSIGTDQIAGGSIAIGTAASAVSIPSGLRIPAISSETTNGILSIGTDQVAGGFVNIGSAFTSYTNTGINLINFITNYTNNSSFVTNSMTVPDGTKAGIFYQGNTFSVGRNVVMNRKVQTDMLTRDIFTFTLPTTALRGTQICELVICGQTTGAVLHFNYRNHFVIAKVNTLFIQVLDQVVLTNFTNPVGQPNLTFAVNVPTSTETSIRIIPPAYSGATGARYTATLTMYGGDDGTGNAFKVVAV